MPVYDLNGNQLFSIYDKDGNDLDYGYDKDGNIVFQKHSEDVLTSYEMFYPNDASGDYEVANGWDTNLTATEFLALKYDDYVTNPPQGITVTKTSLGKDSTGKYNI